ncbi:MAG: hypothetical protein AAFY15_08755, partial [Cyanobacteria bacterium J06648_11]
QSTSDNLNALIVANEGKLGTALDDFALLNRDLREITASLKPILADAEFTANISAIAANAADAATKANEAADNIRVLSEGISDPNTIATLRATLDSARATFENAQKITADLDDLTGDPAFRDNLRDLVDGLNELVSVLPDIEERQNAIAADSNPQRYSSSQLVPEDAGRETEPAL